MNTPAPVPPPRTGRAAGCAVPMAIAVVAVVLIVASVAIVLIVTIGRTTGKVVGAPVEFVDRVAAGLARIGHELQKSEVELIFSQEAREINRTNYLQVATVRAQSYFEVIDRKSIGWGEWQVDLPEVAMIARAPVTFTYYVDLDGPWTFEWHDPGLLLVRAPGVAANEPALDVSQLEFFTTKGSWFRDETKVQANLRGQLTTMARQQARENLRWVRGDAREAVRDFVRKWVADKYHRDHTAAAALPFDKLPLEIRVLLPGDPELPLPPAPTVPPPTER